MLRALRGPGLAARLVPGEGKAGLRRVRPAWRRSGAGGTEGRPGPGPRLRWQRRGGREWAGSGEDAGEALGLLLGAEVRWVCGEPRCLSLLEKEEEDVFRRKSLVWFLPLGSDVSLALRSKPTACAWLGREVVVSALGSLAALSVCSAVLLVGLHYSFFLQTCMLTSCVGSSLDGKMVTR